MVQRQTIRKNMDMSQNEVPYGGLKSTLNKGKKGHLILRHPHMDPCIKENKFQRPTIAKPVHVSYFLWVHMGTNNLSTTIPVPFG